MGAVLVQLREESVHADELSGRFASADDSPGVAMQVWNAPMQLGLRGVGAHSLPGAFERGALHLSDWLGQRLESGQACHLMAYGDGVLLACFLALRKPERLASLILVDPQVLQRGADASSESARIAGWAKEGGEINEVFVDAADSPALRDAPDADAAASTYALALDRKGFVRRLMPELERLGVACPIAIVYCNSFPSGFVSLDVFDLFAKRQHRTELHVIPCPSPEHTPEQTFLHSVRSFIANVEAGD